MSKSASKATSSKSKVKAKAKNHLRGQVALSIKDALAYVGGDDSVVISIGRKSLVEAKTAASQGDALAALESIDNSDL